MIGGENVTSPGPQTLVELSNWLENKISSYHCRNKFITKWESEFLVDLTFQFNKSFSNFKS